MSANQGKKKKNLSGSLTMAGFVLIVALCAGAVYTSEAGLRAREQDYIHKEEALEREIADQEARRSKLEEQQDYVTTDQYIMDIAKDKLGLLSSDEVLLKENEN